MRDQYSLLAFIPARGGSKGLPNKNILDCAGKPLIAWTIEAARSVIAIDEVIVSTDADQIAEVARAHGASVPFLRSPELATDSASLLDAVTQAWTMVVDRAGKPYDYIVVLQPTSPLRSESHIELALNHYFESRCSENDTLASVYPVSPKFGWLMQKSAESSAYIDFCFDINSSNAQRQRLGPYYMPNGAIFVVRGAALSNGLYTERTIPFVMNPADSIDIDTRSELNQAAELLRIRVSTF